MIDYLFAVTQQFMVSSTKACIMWAATHRLKNSTERVSIISVYYNNLTTNHTANRWFPVCGRTPGSPSVPLILIGRCWKGCKHKWQTAIQASFPSRERLSADSSLSGPLNKGTSLSGLEVLPEDHFINIKPFSAIYFSYGSNIIVPNNCLSWEAFSRYFSRIFLHWFFLTPMFCIAVVR